MWTIRQEQVESFRQHHLQKFEDEMVDHCKEFSPTLCKVIGEGQLRVALRSSMRRADGYGFTNRGPIRLFIEMGFLFGSAFDSDPQYPSFGKILQSPDDQMVRAEQIHQGSLEYLDKVSGPDNANVLNALGKLAIFAKKPILFSFENFSASLLHEMRRIFPQKYDYVGKTNLTVLIDEGAAEAHKYGFSTVRQATLMVVLKFAFGHGCTNDPLYRWISATLQDERIVNSAARSERLERRAVTWLTHVLGEPGEGRQA